MATSKITNGLVVWGQDSDEYGGSIPYSASNGAVSGFVSGSLIYAQTINKAFRNATILNYAFVQNLINGVSDSQIPTSFSIAFNIPTTSLSSFVSNLGVAINAYIQNIPVASASAFTAAQWINLTGVVTGSISSKAGWTISTTIGSSKILSNMISDSNITTSKIANNAITTNKIASGAIISSLISNSAIITSAIMDSAITNNKIANNTIGNEKLINNSFAFSNGNYSSSFSLGSTIPLQQIFGFNSSSSSGTLKFNKSTQSFYIEDDTGDNSSFIPNWAMLNNDWIESIYFPKASLVGDCAFVNCQILEQVSLPNVTYIKGAFGNCGTLYSINLPQLNQAQFGFMPGSDFTYNPSSFYSIGGAFQNCTDLQNVYLPNCDILGSYCFANCTWLSNLTNLSSVKQIRQYGLYNTAINSLNNTFPLSIAQAYAFANCSKLSFISFNNLSTLGIGAFANCSNLQYVYLNNVSQIYDLNNSIMNNFYSSLYSTNSIFTGCSKLNVVELKNLSICPPIFSNINTLTRVDIRNVSMIGAFNFYNCTNLSQLTSIDSYNTLSKITDIGACSSTQAGGPGFAFTRCSNLTTLSFPNLTFLSGDGNFDGCINLSQIFVPQLLEIPQFTFRSCSSLTSISLPNCYAIDSSAF